MDCPFCLSSQNSVSNTRKTKENSQVWRRRKCTSCGELFTTYESIDLSHLIVVKKDGNKVRFNKNRIYTSINLATIKEKLRNPDKHIEKVTSKVEKDILYLKKKVINSEEISDIILKNLYKYNKQSFIHYLAYNKSVEDQKDLKKFLKKYKN